MVKVPKIPKRALLFAAVALSFSLNSFAAEYLLNGSKWRTTVAAFFGMLIVRFIWASIIYPFYFSPLRHVPHPEQNSLLFGQFGRILAEPTGYPHRSWMEEVENDGLIYYRGLFNVERVLVTKPKALSEALTLKSYDLIKPPALAKGLSRVVGWGVLLTEGQEHKAQRKHLTPAFSYRHVKDLIPVFWEKSRDMIMGIDKDLQGRDATKDFNNEKGQNHPTQKDNVVQVDGWTSRATLDIIGVAGIGKSFNAIEDEKSELFQTYQILFKQDWQTRLIGLANVFLPVWLIRLLPIPRNVKVAKARLFLSKFCFDILAEKKSKIAAAKEKGESDAAVGGIDILTVALKSGGFTDEQIVDQLLTFIAAGHETTATAMTWAVYVLCEHPEVQTRLREELRATLPDIRDAGAQVSAEQIDQLPYLQAVINEILRFYTPVPMTIRVAAKDITLCGQRIPEGTTVITAMLGVNHDPTLWAENPREFNPERWLGPGRANTGGAESNYANMVFSHGPRGCIGASFAKAEFACLLAAWVLGYETTFAKPAVEPEVTGGVIRRIKGGLDVKITPSKQ